MITQLIHSLRSAGLKVFPCRADKGPAVARGESWKDVAEIPPECLHWPSNIVGVPVPPKSGVLIIDLDTYKGASRVSVESALGVRLDWDRALIQHTMHGGQHYAFRVPRDEAYPTRSNAADIRGLDLRAAGSGYVACGEGYRPVGLGVPRIAFPQDLPELPELARERLRTPDTPERKPSAPPRETPEDWALDRLREALRYIDPGCTREQWIQVAMAIHYAHPDGDGEALFDEWSSGSLSPGGTEPTNYDPADVPKQWRSFKQRDGGIRPNTLFARAIAGGWKPPRGFDMRSLFGDGGQPLAAYQNALQRIRERGADAEQYPTIHAEISGGGFNAVQQQMLMAVLQDELKAAGLLTKDVKKQLSAAPQRPAKPKGEYDTNDTENAFLFLKRCCGDGEDLRRYMQDFWVWTGTHWRIAPDTEIASALTHDMARSFPTNGQIEGTLGVLKKLTESSQSPTRQHAGLVAFRNTCLDVTTGLTIDHSRDLGNAYCLPYDYEAGAQCPRWIAFLRETLEDDEQRASLLQEWFGYMMVMSYDYHKILLMIGPPRSGKGTILRVLRRVVGEENFTGGSLDALAEDYLLEMIQNKSVMAVGDAPRTLGSHTLPRVLERLKAISGADSVPFNRKYKAGRDRTIPCRFVIGANDYPSMFDESGALAGRIMPLPFNVSALGRENPHLLDELLEELPGIAQWALAGLRRLRHQKRFTVPLASLDEIEDLHDTYSPLRIFMRECYDHGDQNDIVLVEEFWTRYLEWCIGRGEPTKTTQRQFAMSLKAHLRGTSARAGTFNRPNGSGRVRGYRGVKQR